MAPSGVTPTARAFGRFLVQSDGVFLKNTTIEADYVNGTYIAKCSMCKPSKTCKGKACAPVNQPAIFLEYSIGEGGGGWRVREPYRVAWVRTKAVQHG